MSFLQDEAGRWYVSDPGHAQDLALLRERVLLREFRTYVEGLGRLKVFRSERSEAVRAGFGDAWRRRDYAVTPALRAPRLPKPGRRQGAQVSSPRPSACRSGWCSRTSTC